MSNDMTRDLNNNINLPKNVKFSGKSFNVDSVSKHEKNLPKNQMLSEENKDSNKSYSNLNHDIDMEKSMGCLMGKAQINSQNHIEEITPQVKKSVEEFLSDPEIIEAHTNLTDELVKRGYCLEDAIFKADEIFENLKKGEIYQL